MTPEWIELGSSTEITFPIGADSDRTLTLSGEQSYVQPPMYLACDSQPDFFMAPLLLTAVSLGVCLLIICIRRLAEGE